MKIPAGDFYGLFMGYICTANEDGSIPINSQVIAQLGATYDEKKLTELITNANAALASKGAK
jgi:hypothetical protein